MRTYEGVINPLLGRIHDFASNVKTTINETVKNEINDFNIPFKTKDRFQGKAVWTIKLDFGELPNTTTKIMLLPPEVTNVWGNIKDRWIDVGESYAYIEDTGETLPLPYTDAIIIERFREGRTKDVISDHIAMKLTDTDLSIETQSDRTDTKAVVVLKYLLPES